MNTIDEAIDNLATDANQNLIVKKRVPNALGFIRRAVDIGKNYFRTINKVQKHSPGYDNESLMGEQYNSK